MKPPHGLVALLAATLAASGARAAGRVPAKQAAPQATTAEIHALIARTIANQHNNDQATYEYEHVERRMRFLGTRMTDDRTYRVVPTGTGTLSLLVKEEQRAVKLDSYLKQLGSWEQVLTVALNPHDPRELDSEQKRGKRDHDRAELVDAVGEAFHFSWLGREKLNGRSVVKLKFDPNPSYRPQTSAADLLTHVEAIVWIDEQAAQLVRAQAKIVRDITIGGGIVGKIYRGGWFEITQGQVAGEIWEPTLTEYAVSARRFLFPFTDHARTMCRRYQHIGPPREALALVRSELRARQAFAGDP